MNDRNTRAVKKYRVRNKWCKTAGFMWTITLAFAFLTVLESRFWPIFIFCLVDLILTVIPAYYVEELEVNPDKHG